MADNVVDFRLKLHDEMSAQIKKTRKLTESSLKSMSKEYVKLTDNINKEEDAIQDLERTKIKASKTDKKLIQAEISGRKKIIAQIKKQASAQKRADDVKNKNTFTDKINKSNASNASSSGGGGLSSMMGKGGVIGAGIAATIGTGMVLNNMIAESEKINQRLRASFQLTGDALVKMNAQVKTLASTFGEDYSEIIQSANTLSKEMGISGAEAMKLIEQGFKKGANNSGEFLDIIKEYPTLMDKAGISAEEFIAITTQMVNKGMYSDKGIDAIKEGGETLLENNKGTKEALKLLPKQTQQYIASAVAQGNTFDAMQLISKELKNMSGTNKFTVTQAIFGAAGLDAGDKMLNFLGEADKSLINIKDTMSEFQKTDFELNEQWNLFVENIISSESTIGNVLNGIKAGFVDLLDIYNNYSDLGVVVNENMKTQSEEYFTKLMEALDNKSTRVSKSAFVNSQITRLEGRIAMAKELEKSSSESLNIGDITDAQNQIGVYGLTLAKLKKFSNTSGVVENSRQLNTVINKDPTVESKANAAADYKAFLRERNSAVKAAKQTQRDLTNIETSKAVKSLTINIGTMVDDGINIETTNISESPAMIEKMMIKMLNNVVNQSGSQILGK